MQNITPPLSNKNQDDIHAEQGSKPIRVRYTIGMNDTSFSLDPKGGEDILVSLAAPEIKQRGQAIAARAQSMASSMSSDPPSISVTNAPGTIRRGVRAIATIKAEGQDAHQSYIGHQALAKAKDAGR